MIDHWFWLGSLIVFRISNLISKEHGPWFIFTKLRTSTKGWKLFDELLTCFKCVSIWVAAGVAGCLYRDRTWLAMTLAMSGLSILMKGGYDYFATAAEIQEKALGPH